MAAQSFLTRIGARITEIRAILSSAGAGDANKIPALDGSGRLDSTFMPSGIGADTLSVVTSENLSAGDLVNLYSNAGTLTARKADNSSAGKEVSGFVISASTSPAANTVYFEGRLSGTSGLTVGGRYYQDPATPGGVIIEASFSPSSGNVMQYVGQALTASTITYEPSDPITVA